MIDPGEKPFVLSSLERARSEGIFEALRAAFRRAEEEIQIVLQCTISNACPPLKEDVCP